MLAAASAVSLSQKREFKNGELVIIVMHLYRARRLKHQYYNDCSIVNCDNDCMVLVQIDYHSFAWVCGMHYMRKRIKNHFGRGLKSTSSSNIL